MVADDCTNSDYIRHSCLNGILLRNRIHRIHLLRSMNGFHRLPHNPVNWLSLCCPQSGTRNTQQSHCISQAQRSMSYKNTDLRRGAVRRMTVAKKLQPLRCNVYGTRWEELLSLAVSQSNPTLFRRIFPKSNIRCVRRIKSRFPQPQATMFCRKRFRNSIVDWHNRSKPIHSDICARNRWLDHPDTAMCRRSSCTWKNVDR